MRSERDTFLDVAGELAHGLAASALWHGDRCNWVGAAPLDHARSPRAIASLGPDLYGGTSGVVGYVGIVGPRRMDYARSIGAVSFVGRLMSDLVRAVGGN